MTGSSLAPVALAFGVLQSTGSVAILGLVMAAYSVPMLVLMVAGGVWADRLPRHRLMMGADIVRCATQTTFGALLIADHHPLVAMVLLQAMAGTAQAFASPAVLGLTAATAPAHVRQQANALLAVTGDVTRIAGPIIAGALTVTIGAGWALVIDGMSFLGSAYFLFRLQLPPSQRRRSHFLADVVAGWREVSRRSWLWASIGYFAVFNLVFAIFMVLGPARLAGTANGALSWAVVTAAMAVGTLCGNGLALRFTPRYLLRWGRLLELLVVPAILALALGASVQWLAATALLMGIAMSYPDALWYTALQQEIPENAISRVSSFDNLGSFVSRPLGYTLAASFMAVGPQRALFVIASIFVTSTLLTLLVPGVRNLARRVETTLETQVPDPTQS
jgi:MFS family permease